MKLASHRIPLPFETATLDCQHGENRAQYDEERRRIGQEEPGVIHPEHRDERSRENDADERRKGEGDLLHAELLIEPIEAVMQLEKLDGFRSSRLNIVSQRTKTPEFASGHRLN